MSSIATVSDLFASFAVFAQPLKGLPPELSTLGLVWSFVIGSLFGSFLNVVILRIPHGLSVVRPRSRCVKCGELIRWFDNIPVVSWVLLRGKCRYCGVSISARYALIEMTVGLFAVGIAYQFGLNLMSLERLVFVCVMVAIAFIDLDTWTIPFEVVIPGVCFAFFFAAIGLWMGHIGHMIVPGVDDVHQAALERVLGGIVGFLALNAFRVLATVYLRKKGRIEDDQEAMGLGDPLLLGLIGCFVGWKVLPIVLFLAATQGTIAGLILKIAGHLHEPKVAVEIEGDDWQPPSDAIQFGPFLVLAGLEVAFLGITWIPFFSKVVNL